jgi:hypothetical protein
MIVNIELQNVANILGIFPTGACEIFEVFICRAYLLEV